MNQRQAAIGEWVLRVAAAAGLGVSALLAYEYLGPEVTLCGEGGGCDVVRESGWAWPLGIPMPLLGVLYFGAVLALSGLRGRARRLLLVWTLAGGLAAVGFVLLQASVLHAWCKYCLIADGAALLIAAAAVPALGAPGGVPRWRGQLAIGAVAGAVALVPLSISWLQPAAPEVLPVAQAELPAPVAAEQRAGVATIVEYLDFQCPVCRRLHARLAELLRDYPQVRVVRKMMPLSRHEFAEPAARSWCCADDAGHGDAMADALMSASSLEPSDCEELAAGLGLDLDQYRACVADERTADRVRTDKAGGKQIGIRGVPTFWIGREKFVGLPQDAIIRASLDRAVAAARL